MLIIGYGNELRGDDGVGPKTVEAIAALKLPGVQCLSCHQLTPELAETISRANRVVFVDAAVTEAGTVEVQELAAAESAVNSPHSINPAVLLGMAKQLYGSSPRAWLVTIPVRSTDFIEKLTPLAERGMAEAIQRIQALAAERA